MRRATKVTFASVALAMTITVAACKKSQDKAPPPSPPPPATTPAAPAVVPAAAPAPDLAGSWQEHAGAGFTVRAPNAPKVTTQDVVTTLGKLPTELYGAYAAEDSPGALSVAVTKFPAAGANEPAKILRDGLDGLVAKFAGKLDKQATITVGGEAGVDAVISGTHPQMGPFVVRWRGVVHKGALYQVQCMRDPSAAEFGAIGDAFIDSFAFKD